MVASDELRLTELAQLAGCAGKAGPDTVAMVLRLLAEARVGAAGEPGDLLVGLDEPDDAAVYALSDEQALVVTVDFFAPLVDDPYSYGAISAANALSDVYAMGGEVALALNISGFPTELPEETVSQILRGGADKVVEAGGVIAGGHTIIDAEPKYGLCVIGFVHPDRVLRKSGAEVGDAVYLTKPLGTGLITTAAKFEEAEAEHLQTAIETMCALNRGAAKLARDCRAHSLTDVTGFGMLGHANEIAQASDVGLRLEAVSIPLLPGALEYAYRGILTGGGQRNRRYLDGRVEISSTVSEELRHVLYDPQTSGGLLMTLDQARAPEFEAHALDEGVSVWRVGQVIAGAGVTVV